jgi:hypothetical protein
MNATYPATYKDRLGNKNAYLAVRGKHDLFRIWSTMTEFVQETYLCPEFLKRRPGAGY